MDMLVPSVTARRLGFRVVVYIRKRAVRTCMYNSRADFETEEISRDH